MDIRFSMIFLTVTSSMLAVTSEISPQIPIPVLHPGFILQGTRNSEIVIEVFLELNCKDSKETWPILKQMASKYKKYQENMSVIIHMFPLPYHRCGFFSSQAWNLVIDHKEDEAVSFINAAFAEMNSFSNRATWNMTNDEIQMNLANLVRTSTSIPNEYFFQHFNDFIKPTILHWKYAVKRGVAGTPWYFVNGVDLTVPAKAISMETWEAIVDPLLNSTSHLRKLETATISPPPKPTSSAIKISAAIDFYTIFFFIMMCVYL